jgi:hypothetical protein
MTSISFIYDLGGLATSTRRLITVFLSLGKTQTLCLWIAIASMM